MPNPDRRKDGIPHAQEVRAAQLRLLYEQAPPALVASLANAAMLLAGFWEAGDRPALLLWFLIGVGVVFARHRLRRSYFRCRPCPADAPRWERRYLAGAALNGVLWGVAGYAFFRPASPVHQLLLAFVLGGMASGAIATLAPLRGAYPVFLLPALLPYAVRLFCAGGGVHPTMGAMVLLYVAMMAMISRRLHRTVAESLRLRFANLDLLSDLILAGERQKQANLELARQVAEKQRARQALEQANRELEDRVRERTESLARSEEALREAARRKDEFLAMLGHELRNPLAPIRNAVTILGRPGAPESARDASRDIIDRQVAHLARLVDDLLDVSRIVQGKIDLRPVALDLAAVLRQAVEASRPLIAARHHALSVALPETPLCIQGDPVRLAQVFSNLLNNAAKYTDPGGHIRLETELRDRAIAIRVRDDGVGIPPALLPRVFDPFTQADPSQSRSQGGLGIGLTLVKRLVEMHGGRVEAHSEGAGRGTEFVVWLPRRVELSEAG